MYINRILELDQLLCKKSHFLLGPRQTGKSSLIKKTFANQYPIIDLLRTDIYLRLEAAPWEIENMLPRDTKVAIIDEVQRVPILLNEVHRLIEDRKITFLLTGSSARKLKRNDANMLAGRAWKVELFPLVYAEIINFDLYKYLLYGGLPVVYLSDNPENELAAYIDTYLKNEIQAEAMVRNLPAFVRFLNGSAITSGQILNFTKIASDLQVAPNTVKEFYSILEDTLIGFTVNPFSQTKKRKAVSTSKFYYFDVGVKNYLCGINSLAPKTELFGQVFEHFIALELRAYLSYFSKKYELCFWNTKNNQEVDFIIGNELAIEVKSSDRITTKHISGLKTIREEGIIKKYCIICFDKSIYEIDGIIIYYWQDFLEKLWQHKII